MVGLGLTYKVGVRNKVSVKLCYVFVILRLAQHACVRVYCRQETINTYYRCGLWDSNEINSVNLAVLTDISRIHIRDGKLVLDGKLV
jgi:hypothetical protein